MKIYAYVTTYTSTKQSFHSQKYMFLQVCSNEPMLKSSNRSYKNLLMLHEKQNAWISIKVLSDARMCISSFEHDSLCSFHPCFLCLKQLRIKLQYLLLPTIFMSRNQLNQKLKLMVEAPRYVVYSNTPPHTRAYWAKSVDAHRHRVFHFKWRVGEIRTRDILSRWLQIPCQGTNSTNSLSWWLKPHDMLHILTVILP